MIRRPTVDVALPTEDEDDYALHRIDPGKKMGVRLCADREQPEPPHSRQPGEGERVEPWERLITWRR